LSDCICVVGDWDADGMVSVAEIVYAQEFLGLYPARGKRSTCIFPSTPNTINLLVKPIIDRGCEYLLILDIAYSHRVQEFINKVREKSINIIYIDHHLSSIINSHAIEKIAYESFIGKAPTAILVYHLLSSLGINLTDRLKAFISSISRLEHGNIRRSGYNINKRLIDIVANLSRYVSQKKDRELWERIVRWLSSPLPSIALPFSTEIYKLVKIEDSSDLKIFASEIAIEAKRIFNLRFIDLRSRKVNYRASAIASALYRIFRMPIAILIKNSKGHELIVIKSRDTTAYTIALELYRRGIAVDLMGHQTLAIALIKSNTPTTIITNTLREIMISHIGSGPAGT